MRALVRLWLPLAASRGILMLDMSIVAMFLTRTPAPTEALAAYGAVVVPIAYLIEAPVWMLLGASVALCSTPPRARAVLRFGWGLAGVLLTVEALIVFTPLYGLVTRALAVTPEVAAAAWPGLVAALPWIPCVADRRIHQGRLIRAGDSRAVGAGTTLRLLVMVVSFAALTAMQPDVPPVGASAAALSLGLVLDMVYVRYRWRRVARAAGREPGVDDIALSVGAVARYYVPLALTSMLATVRGPLGTAAMFRLPAPIVSNAVVPLVRSLADVFQAIGVANNEVAVAKLAEGARDSVWRFTVLLAGGASAAVLIVAITPLTDVWFAGVLGLPAEHVPMARIGLLLLAPVPALAILQGYYQAEIMVAGETRRMTEATVVNVVTLAGVLLAATWWGAVAGIYATMLAITLASALQLAWLWSTHRRRSEP